MKTYKWDKHYGVLDEADQQRIQLIGGSHQFRTRCGKLLAQRRYLTTTGLGVVARGPELPRMPTTSSKRWPALSNRASG